MSRHIVDALLPPGSIWTPQTGGDLDNLLDGIGDNLDALRAYIMGMAEIRDPARTRILAELETEFGIVPDDSTSDAVRRQRLAAIMFAKDSNGSDDYLQTVLQAAGFDVLVHQNNPAANPSDIMSFSGFTIMGNSTAVCGNVSAYHSQESGELLVNGPLYVSQVPVTYGMPTSEYWPLVFFIGAAAERDYTGTLTAITFASVPASRKAEFIRLIIKFKPMYTWAGLLINYV